MKNILYKILLLGSLPLSTASYSYPVEYSPASMQLTPAPTEGVGEPEDDLMAFLGMEVTNGICFYESDFSGSSVMITIPNESTQVKGVQLIINDEYRSPDLIKEANYVSFDIYEKIDFSSNVKMMCDVYMNKDMVWVQTYRMDPKNISNSQNPVESTVFFTGVPDYFYYQFRAGYFPGKFTKYARFKSKIQEKYANLYDPDRPGMVNYRRSVKSSAFNFIN